MTGIYVRIQRDGRLEDREIDELSDQELVQLARDQPLEAGWRWAILLAGWIRDTLGKVGNEEAYE